ncbi:hypothetical protein [methane-oxidizing endosymbiont of Gigantopelta aegis]|uniref:hypothetical protein n=1 Tax=methane-oxidizing endosymbiont of Gigantopelta aegis TaxID=2794938 RepID=UPI001BE4929F|nr:hypothetical protein [methane-oxidizing endosymbiont of Gigantopelta aegis]
MMAMSAYFVIAEVLDIDAMELEDKQDLDHDLHLTEKKRQLLSDSIEDMFNGLKLDFSKIHQIKDIVAQVINQNVNTLH